MPKRKADENGTLGHQHKDSKTCITDFQRGISIKYTCEIFTRETPYITAI